MFGISFSEIALIFIITLLIFGPKRLPQIITTIGKIINQIKSYVYNFKNDIYNKSGFNEIKNTKQEILNIYNNLKETINLQNENINNISTNTLTYTDEEPLIYFQPELDFDREPELFDEIINEPRTNK